MNENNDVRMGIIKSGIVEEFLKFFERTGKDINLIVAYEAAVMLEEIQKILEGHMDNKQTLNKIIEVYRKREIYIMERM